MTIKKLNFDLILKSYILFFKKFCTERLNKNKKHKTWIHRKR